MKQCVRLEHQILAVIRKKAAALVVFEHIGHSPRRLLCVIWPMLVCAFIVVAAQLMVLVSEMQTAPPPCGIIIQLNETSPKNMKP